MTVKFVRNREILKKNYREDLSENDRGSCTAQKLRLRLGYILEMNSPNRSPFNGQETG